MPGLMGGQPMPQGGQQGARPQRKSLAEVMGSIRTMKRDEKRWEGGWKTARTRPRFAETSEGE
jgi:hypothetical protein